MMSEMRNRATKIKKKILPISAIAPARFPKPIMAEMMIKMINIKLQRSIGSTL